MPNGNKGKNPKAKDPIAVELGRRGGKIGGKRRAESMSKKKRSEAARHAANVRWERYRAEKLKNKLK